MFDGVWTALVTPYDNDGKFIRSDYDALIEKQIAAGIKGFVPAGSTGEAATLSHAEHLEVIQAAVEASSGRARVIAGTGSNSTREAVSLSQAAEDAGADAVLLITPYYNKPTQTGLLKHFLTVADAIEIPIILYNIPGRTAVELTVETVARLAQHRNIAGIKEANGDVLRVTEYRRAIGNDFQILSGDDALTFSMQTLGGNGVISVATHLIPEKFVAMDQALRDGDLEAARTLHNEIYPLIHPLFVETNPTPIKYALARLGMISTDTVRAPLAELSSASKSVVDDALAAAGLL